MVPAIALEEFGEVADSLADFFVHVVEGSLGFLFEFLDAELDFALGLPLSLKGPLEIIHVELGYHTRTSMLSTWSLTVLV